MTDKQCERCGEVNPAEIHTCTPQEPAAWMYEFGTDNGDAVNEIRWYPNVHWKKPTGLVRNVVPLYTAPPQPTKLINVNGVLEQAGYVKKKEWQGLTDEEIISSPYCANESDSEVIRLARDIEAKLKEKNG